MKNATLVAATAVLALLAGGGGWASGRALTGPAEEPAATASASVTQTPSATPSATAVPTGTPSATPEQLLEAAKRATVRLRTPAGATGSGTVLSEDGLVLTNAHVAADQAPGLAFHYAEPATQPNPEHLVVGLTPPGDAPAVDTYRASLVVADGYLDLAVVRIDAMADGSPLPAGLRFPSLQLGSVDDLATGDSITVLGYPGVAADGESLSVTRGEIATFARDPAGRVDDDRYEIDTSARIARGNSGGAAIDDAGRLIGVPSAAGLIEDEYTGRIRPIDLAQPLLEAARSGAPDEYVTPYDVLGTGEEQAEPVGWGTGDVPCPEAGEDELTAGAQELTAAAQYSGMTKGEDLLFVLARPGRAEPLDVRRSTWGDSLAEGCLSISWSSDEIGAPEGFPPGSYEMRVHAGPQLRLLTTVPVELT